MPALWLYRDTARTVCRAYVETGKIGAQAEMFAAFEQLMSSIVSNSEDVGQNFAEEARRIHYLEAPVRSILGEASDEEYESLLDEGIEVLRLPIVKKSIN